MAKKKKRLKPGPKPSGLPKLDAAGRVTPRISLKMPTELRARIESRLGDGETMTDFILAAIEARIAGTSARK